MKDKLLKPAEVCERLGITLGTFYNWVTQKRIRVVHLSKRATRVRESVVERLVKDREALAIDS